MVRSRPRKDVDVLGVGEHRKKVAQGSSEVLGRRMMVRERRRLYVL